MLGLLKPFTIFELLREIQQAQGRWGAVQNFKNTPTTRRLRKLKRNSPFGYSSPKQGALLKSYTKGYYIF